MRKLKYATAIMLLSVMVCGCQKQAKTVSIYDRGLELIHDMVELVDSDVYSQLIGVNTLQDIVDKIKEVDYKTPKSVYRVTLSDDLVSAIMTSEEQDTYGMKEMSPELKEIFQQKLFQSIPVQANGRFGATELAVVGSYTVNQTFSSKEIKTNQYYVYVFDQGFPIIVDFTVGEDHSVNANGHFIMTNDFDDTVEGIKTLMNLPGVLECNIEKVNK